MEWEVELAPQLLVEKERYKNINNYTILVSSLEANLGFLSPLKLYTLASIFKNADIRLVKRHQVGPDKAEAGNLIIYIEIYLCLYVLSLAVEVWENIFYIFKILFSLDSI